MEISLRPSYLRRESGAGGKTSCYSIGGNVAGYDQVSLLSYYVNTKRNEQLKLVLWIKEV